VVCVGGPRVAYLGRTTPVSSADAYFEPASAECRCYELGGAITIVLKGVVELTLGKDTVGVPAYQGGE